MKAITRFSEFSLLEKKGDLKKLVGKKPQEELTVNDAKKIGSRVARMEGDQKKKYVGILSYKKGKQVNQLFGRGMEIARRDTPNIMRNLLTQVIIMILEKKTVEEIKNYINKAKKFWSSN